METVSHYQHDAATEEHLQYVTQAHYNGVPVLCACVFKFGPGQGGLHLIFHYLRYTLPIFLHMGFLPFRQK